VKGDAAATYWLLHLSRPICSNASSDDPAEANVTTLQLVFMGSGNEYARYKGLVGRSVIISGTLYHQNTGHHHTRVLLTVGDIRAK
jgi:hypothetical protein